MGLVEFLLARIEEDEAAAHVEMIDVSTHGDLAAGKPTFLPGAEKAADRRVLAECEAKRRIIALHKPKEPPLCHCGKPWAEHEGPYPRAGCYECATNDGRWCETLYLLGLPYADHPDYRPEWSPDG